RYSVPIMSRTAGRVPSSAPAPSSARAALRVALRRLLDAAEGRPETPAAPARVVIPPRPPCKPESDPRTASTIRARSSVGQGLGPRLLDGDEAVPLQALEDRARRRQQFTALTIVLTPARDRRLDNGDQELGRRPSVTRFHRRAADPGEPFIQKSPEPSAPTGSPTTDSIRAKLIPGDSDDFWRSYSRWLSPAPRSRPLRIQIKPRRMPEAYAAGGGVTSYILGAPSIVRPDASEGRGRPVQTVRRPPPSTFVAPDTRLAIWVGSQPRPLVSSSAQDSTSTCRIWHGRAGSDALAFWRLFLRPRSLSRLFLNPIPSLWRGVDLHVCQDPAEKLVECSGLLSKFEGVPWTDPVYVTGVCCDGSRLPKFMKQVRRTLVDVSLSLQFFDYARWSAPFSRKTKKRHHFP